MLIRNYSGGDEKSILELFEQTYGKPLSPEFWRWRFAENPYGNLLIQLADDSGKLAAHYAVSSVRFQSKGRQYLAAHSMTTMTHPEYQGRGLFTKLAADLYASLKDKGYKFVWGFPNQNSFYGFIKNLGWKSVAEIPTLICNTPAVKDSSLVCKTDFSVASYEVFWSEIKGSYIFSIDKDAQYIRWRYLAHPTNKYQTYSFFEGTKQVGFCVVKPYEDKGVRSIDVLECHAVDSACLDKVLAWLRGSFIGEQGYNKLHAWLNVSSTRYLNYFKNGFRHMTPLTYLGICILSELGSSVDVESYKNWEIAMGDSDVY